MYAVFTRFDQETRQRAYDLFGSLPLANYLRQSVNNPTAYRVAEFDGSPDRRALICPIGACNAVVYGAGVDRDQLFPIVTVSDEAARQFQIDYDGGLIVDLIDLADAMGVLV